MSESILSNGPPPEPPTPLLPVLPLKNTVLFPFLFWYGTWFGRRLTDAQIEQYLHDTAKPRHAQHALVQIGERLGRGDSQVARWYPAILDLSRNNLI